MRLWERWAVRKGISPHALGFGCSVPAVMATRALESVRDRRRTIAIIPFMSCSARLPIYVLFAEMFFPENALLAAYSLYLLGLAAGIAMAYIVHKTREDGGTGTPCSSSFPSTRRPMPARWRSMCGTR